jgi:hypothetical protein
LRASIDHPHLVEKWDQMAQAIQDRNLEGVCSEHCLLDGILVQTLLGVHGSNIAASIRLILQARLAVVP